MGSEVLLEQVQLNFSFRNKFIILLPCGHLVDNNTVSSIADNTWSFGFMLPHVLMAQVFGTTLIFVLLSNNILE